MTYPRSNPTRVRVQTPQEAYDDLAENERQFVQAWITGHLRPANERLSTFDIRAACTDAGLYVKPTAMRGALAAAGYSPIRRTERWFEPAYAVELVA